MACPCRTTISLWIEYIMSYKSFNEARADWIPEESAILGEYEDTGRTIVICVHDGWLYIVRFFLLGAEQWVASTDYAERVENVGDI